ncbi:MAG: DUF3500 domain-containing protein [Planctomycetota bacterium]|nr:DUF3500 domain-containing protein [Planctomycetota bacterium]
MRRIRLTVSFLFAASAALVFSYDRLADSPGEKMSEAAGQLLGSLDDGQKAKIRVAYDAAERVNWHFVPLDARKGLPLKEMNEEQRKYARSLLNTALSESGYKKADSIMHLEQLLQALEGDGRRWPRDWLLYYVTIFGEPSETGRWGLSWEGHHLSLNFVVENGRIVSSTPQFMGANPATVMTGGAGVEKGTRVLAAEEQLAFDLLASLTPEQRKVAIVSSEAPKEIRAAGEAQPPKDAAVGLPLRKMTESQRQILRKLGDAYASSLPQPVVDQRIAAIHEAGIDDIHFAWFGAEKPGVGHGYRIQGPTFLIEFVNTQPDAEGNPANHIHSVWRDLRGDFAIPVK